MGPSFRAQVNKRTAAENKQAWIFPRRQVEFINNKFNNKCQKAWNGRVRDNKNKQLFKIEERVFRESIETIEFDTNS